MAKGDVQTVALLVVADALERVDLESLEYRLDRREPYIPVRQFGDQPDEGRKTMGVATRAPMLKEVQYPISVTEIRSEERRVGKECVSTCNSRRSRCH